MMVLRNYTRWQKAHNGRLVADILGAPRSLEADPAAGLVVYGGDEMTPDEARLLGVRLIDAAVLADGDRAIRQEATR